MWRKGKSCALSVGTEIRTAIMENSMEGFQKLKIDLPYDPHPVYIQEKRNQCQGGICTPTFVTALLADAKKRKQPQCPSAGERIKQIPSHSVEHH